MVEDLWVREALHYIRDHANTPIQVGDVERAVGLSRRTLEKRFKAVLGRSILQEIRLRRTELITRLLVETNIPIMQIARALGFSDEAKNISRYFQHEMGMSPQEFPRRYGRN